MDVTNLQSLVALISGITKPTLFLMVGQPYSGKTFVSKFISENLKIESISFDETWVKLSSTREK